MKNEHILQRLEGIQKMLMGAHVAGTTSSDASKGREREAFINSFLADILPPHFRFGSGDATDQEGRKSGQLDIVVEYPFLPSLPIVSGSSPRLYLAEGVVAVIEVKSNVKKAWKEVIGTAEKLAGLERQFGSGLSIGPRAGRRIPLYAVGYVGWKRFSDVKKKVEAAEHVNGVLVIDEGHFFGSYDYIDRKDKKQPFACQFESSPMALWGLVACIHHAASMVTSTTKDVPRRYGGYDA